MKAVIVSGLAASAALLLAGSTASLHAQGYIHIGPSDVVALTNEFNPGALADNPESMRLRLRFVPNPGVVGHSLPLFRETNFRRDNGGVSVNPVVAILQLRGAGADARIVGEIFDGERLLVESQEVIVKLGTEARPGTLPTPLVFPPPARNDTRNPSFWDSSFKPSLARNGSTNDLRITGLHVQPDGKIIAAGNFTEVNGAPQNGVVRLLPNGSTDPSFASGLSNGVSITTSLLLPSGSILLAGDIAVSNETQLLVRLGTNGMFESSVSGFPSNTVTTMKLQPDGKIMAGLENPARLLRFLSNGQPDLETWTSPLLENGTNDAIIHAIDFTESSVRVGGEFTSVNGQLTGSYVQLTLGGSLDTSAPRVLVQGPVYTIDGQLIGGAFTNINGSSCSNLARITSTNVLCGVDAVPTVRTSLSPIQEIIDEGRILLDTAGPIGRTVYYPVFPSNLTRAKTAVAYTGTEIYIAGPNHVPPGVAVGEISRYTGTREPGPNQFRGLDYYGDFLLLRPVYGWTTEFEYSSNLVNWHPNPEGIRDTNTTSPARFYRAKHQP